MKFGKAEYGGGKAAEWSGVRAQSGLSKSGGYRFIGRQRHIKDGYQGGFDL